MRLLSFLAAAFVIVSIILAALPTSAQPATQSGIPVTSAYLAIVFHAAATVPTVSPTSPLTTTSTSTIVPMTPTATRTSGVPEATHSPTVTRIAAASPTASPMRGTNCDASYPTVCIPPPPPDLNCDDIPYTNFTVLPPDPHKFDTDHDGIGCETR